MPISLTRLNTKLQAIRDKNLDDIMSKKVHLPFVGSDYTRAGLEEWIAERTTLLEQAVGATDQQIQNRITNYYESLGAEDKAIADKIMIGEPFELSDASGRIAYEKLVAILLTNYIKE